MHPTPQRARGPLAALGAAAILASALTLLGTAALAQGVVTLETPAPPGTQPSAAPGATAAPPSDPQEAMLAYVECMRDHGVDMPDPEFTADGRVTMRIGGEGRPAAGAAGGPGDPAFQEAQEACGSLMQGTVRDLDPEQQAEMQARALAFAECMREHGVDMPDPQFDENGGVGIMIGGPDAPPIDAETMQAAQEACGGLMGPPGVDDPSDTATPRPSGDLP
jgi:hypothetical protein